MSRPTSWSASTTGGLDASCCDDSTRWLTRPVPSPGAARDTSVTVAFTYQGLRALGVPPTSLDSFAPEFRQGMAARAAHLGDVGESSPAAWESPLGSPDVHVAARCPVARRRPVARRPWTRARRTYHELRGVEVIWRQDCYQLPTGRTSFGFKDGIGQPAIEGSGMPGTNPMEPPIKAGEFILGYPDETGALPSQPSPEILGRNGTYIAFRKLHTRVAAYRQYLRANAASRQEEPLLGAKMVGRWQSGAPLALCPDRDDPDLGIDRKRNNRFLYADDLGGFRCPAGAHARRANPRDSLDGDGSVNVRLHRMIRRGTSYGPPLPEGVLDDDGVDRGIVFVFVGTHLDRQFEFVKTQWLNDGVFIGAPEESDPLVGSAGGGGRFTIPQRPIRRRLQGVPAVCGHPGRRVLLRSGITGPQLARRARDLIDPLDKEAGKVTAQPTGADRWAALGFGPPATGLPEPDQPVVVDYVHDGRIAVITLNRPSADNAITTEMGALLTEILETIAVRIEVRVAILTGAGDRAFSVGSDLRQRQDDDQGRLAAAASRLRPNPLHRAPVTETDLRGRERDCLWGRLRVGPEHRLHYRLRERRRSVNRRP